MSAQSWVLLVVVAAMGLLLARHFARNFTGKGKGCCGGGGGSCQCRKSKTPPVNKATP